MGKKLGILFGVLSLSQVGLISKVCISKLYFSYSYLLSGYHQFVVFVVFGKGKSIFYGEK